MKIIFTTRIKSCLILAVWAALGSGLTLAGDNGIIIKKAKYGDLEQMKTCSPSLSICEGRSLCEFMVGDELCNVPSGAGNARNLEVFWACGGGQEKARAAAKGTKITLQCP